jgi:predicted transcriptional regulator
MSATELVQQIEALPEQQRAEVIERLHKSAPKWVPESFREGMADIAAGRTVDLDEALSKPFPHE